jgi:hypothetical protein
MDRRIVELCGADIGGDEQRVSEVKTSYNAVRFKHVLLPLYLSSYRYRERTFRFQANGQTGEVSGERPYSLWKILLLVMSLLAILALILWTQSESRRSSDPSPTQRRASLSPKEADDPRVAEGVLDLLPRYLGEEGVQGVGEAGFDLGEGRGR